MTPGIYRIQYGSRSYSEYYFFRLAHGAHGFMMVVTWLAIASLLDVKCFPDDCRISKGKHTVFYILKIKKFQELSSNFGRNIVKYQSGMQIVEIHVYSLA